jgi:hypothetical protein
MINIVIDRSGSMAENGKPMLILNLLRYIRQCLGVDKVQFHVLNNQLSHVFVDPTLDLELPEITGSMNMDDGIEFLNERKTEPTILLSDGFFELTESQKRVFKQQNVIVVAVGADADITGLDYLGLPVYLAQDIGVAIKHASTIFSVLRIVPPLQRCDVQFGKSVLVEVHEQDDGEDDDWG